MSEPIKPPPADAEADAFMAICRKERGPDMIPYRAGYEAHADGLQFHECPHDFQSVAGLSWRIGWNDRALAQDLHRSRN